MTRIRTALRATYEVRVWQWMMIWAAVLALAFGAAGGAAVYVQDQREQSERRAAQAAYLTEVARFENDRDEHARCVGAVTQREDFRRLLLQTQATFAGFVHAVRVANPQSAVIAGLQEQVDAYTALIEADWPARNLGECGDPPTPPWAD
jgi:hypothetical protein